MVLTFLNSGSDVFSRKGVFVFILESTAGSNSCFRDDYNLVFNMDIISSESLVYKSVNDMSVFCSSVCIKSVEAVVGLDGLIVYVTEDSEGSEEDD